MRISRLLFRSFMETAGMLRSITNSPGTSQITDGNVVVLVGLAKARVATSGVENATALNSGAMLAGASDILVVLSFANGECERGWISEFEAE